METGRNWKDWDIDWLCPKISLETVTRLPSMSVGLVYTPFQTVLSVTHTICKGPKLDALGWREGELYCAWPYLSSIQMWTWPPPLPNRFVASSSQMTLSKLMRVFKVDYGVKSTLKSDM